MQCNVSTDTTNWVDILKTTHGLALFRLLFVSKKPLISVTMMWLCCTGQETGPAKTRGGRNFHEAVVMSAAAGNRHTPNTRRNALLIKPYESD